MWNPCTQNPSEATVVQRCLLFKRVIIICSSLKQFHNLNADCKLICQSCLLFKRIKGASSNNIKNSLLSPDLQLFLKHAFKGISRFSFFKVGNSNLNHEQKCL